MVVWVDAVGMLSLVAVIRKGEWSTVALVMLVASVSVGLSFTLSVLAGAITGQ